MSVTITDNTQKVLEKVELVTDGYAKINEFEQVRIKKTGETGVVVDIRGVDDKFFLVERDLDNELVDCVESDLEVYKA